MPTELRDCAGDSKILEQVTYLLSGQIEEEDIAELEALIRSEAKGRRIVLGLKNLTLAMQSSFSIAVKRTA